MDRNAAVATLCTDYIVALREGCVDRNHVGDYQYAGNVVALREGCVDRNFGNNKIILQPIVALREGCVDRNLNRICLLAGYFSRTPRGVRG